MSEITLERISSIQDGQPTVSIEVLTTVDLPKSIFKYKVSSTGVDVYQALCTVEDLATFGEVRSGGAHFYRKSSVTITYSSLAEAIEGKSQIVEEIQDLLDTYTQAYSSFISTEQLKLEAL